VRSQWIRIRGPIAEGDLTCRAGHVIDRGGGVRDGIYAGWQWDGRELAIEQDRYGLFPLFEWRSPESRTISTDLLALVGQGAPLDPDFDALAVFLRVGFFVGDDTPFRAIRALVRAVPQPAALPLSRDEAIDAFLELFARALARRPASGAFHLPLSGGRDSRHILFALCDAGHPPDACVTVRHFPPRANDDELIARELCAALGITHRVLDQPDGRAPLERRKNVATHLCTDEHAQFVALADHLRAHTRETYDGIAGDVLSQSAYLRREVQEKFDGGDIRGVAEFVLDGYGTMMSERALARLLAPAVVKEVTRERAVARLTTELARYADAPNPIAAFFFANRTRREIALAPYALMRDITVFAPYLDHDLFDLLAALPARLLMDRALHTEAIARAWPQHTRIPYERKGLLVEDRWAARALAAELLRASVRGPARAWLRTSAIAPALGATLLDGHAGRLWGASLLLWLDQTAAAAAVASA